ncbi:MAG: hypothetical protein PVI60_12780, partial [Desulfobacteraceae bacterium]
REGSNLCNLFQRELSIYILTDFKGRLLICTLLLPKCKPLSTHCPEPSGFTAGNFTQAWSNNPIKMKQSLYLLCLQPNV